MWRRYQGRTGGSSGGGQLHVFVCMRVCAAGGKGSRLAESPQRRSGPLIKSEGQTGGLPPVSIPPSVPHWLSHSPATGYSEAL